MKLQMLCTTSLVHPLLDLVSIATMTLVAQLLIQWRQLLQVLPMCRERSMVMVSAQVTLIW